ncbi:MAG: transglycosylase SLT domain-containing protein [Deltaproteobacteria bacterium]|nr:transglycosylase SLT domain-containing protein [Deltaproteobacteria bacterium]
MRAKRKKAVQCFGSRKRLKPVSRAKSSNEHETPPLPAVHPWRVCPYGEHWVKTHPMHVSPSKTHPDGSITTRHEHCAHNPSGKDQLYPDEIQEITNQNFSDLKNKPCPLPLGFGTQGSKYDDLIAGWVQYWNEVLKPKVPLDPNLVKALIASESGFDPSRLAKPKNSNSARGLAQITNGTRKLLDGDKGGLKDHLITATRSDLNDPSVNICAGVRWLFEKRRLATSRLKKPAAWIDTIWEYKGTKLASKKEAENIKNIFNKFYGEYQKCGRK